MGGSKNIVSYTEHNGQLQVKAVDPMHVSYTGAYVDLATLGQPGDIQHIAAVAFQMVSYGSAGNTCTYGYAVFGVQFAVGGIKVKWSKNSDLDTHGGKLMTPWMHPSHAAPGPGASLHRHSDADPCAGHSHSGDVHAMPSSISPDFHIPAVDHFF